MTNSWRLLIIRYRSSISINPFTHKKSVASPAGFEWVSARWCKYKLLHLLSNFNVALKGCRMEFTFISFDAHTHWHPNYRHEDHQVWLPGALLTFVFKVRRLLGWRGARGNFRNQFEVLGVGRPQHSRMTRVVIDLAIDLIRVQGLQKETPWHRGNKEGLLQERIHRNLNLIQQHRGINYSNCPHVGTG